MVSKIYYRGQPLFLYVQFKDEDNNPIEVINPMFRITYEKNEDIVSLYDWKPLINMSQYEYYFNVFIPENADYSNYDIEYVAETLDGKIARVYEDFHVIPKSESYDNAVKVYGFIHQSRVGYPLIGASIKISLPDRSRVVFETYTKLDGRWEAYLYPGEYIFQFQKFGFQDEEVVAQIGSQHNEIQFDNITLESVDAFKKGNGIYTISDKYVTREGTPLSGLNVKAYNVFNIDKLEAEDTTNEDGEFQIFLDPGLYLLKVEGYTVMGDFNQTFRLRIEDNGEFNFENLTQNIGVPLEEEMVDQGDPNEPGIVMVQDYVKDLNGIPIIDVQVCVFDKYDTNKMIAQDYTNPAGQWTVYLQPGTYIFDFYHPEFHEFQEERTIQ